MRVQFKCCLCGQTNTTEVDPDDPRHARPRGLFARLFGSRKNSSKPPRYTVSCEFCQQNNSITSNRLPPPKKV